MPIVKEHGAAVVALTIDEEGQARTAEWKVQVATRLIEDLTGDWGMHVEDIIVDCLTFPIATGQEETRRDALETIEAIRELKRRYPAVQTTLGVSNVSFGLNPAARIVLNSVFLHECVKAGSTRDRARRQDPADDQDPTSSARGRARPGLRPAAAGYDPLHALPRPVRGRRHGRASTATAPRSWPRCRWRAAGAAHHRRRAQRPRGRPRRGARRPAPALDIINDHLLEGMKVVGELFGSGEMQLPFVLQSAEVMKAAVAYLEPHMEKTDGDGKGTIVLATVKGDVHDIGKNLVDIILTNNGYKVVNLGIKQPISRSSTRPRSTAPT